MSESCPIVSGFVSVRSAARGEKFGSIMEYDEFEIRFRAESASDYQVEVSTTFGDRSRGRFHKPFKDADLVALADQVGAARRARGAEQATTREVRPQGRPPDAAAAQAFGTRLFDALFYDAIGATYRASLKRAQANHKGLRIRFVLGEAPALAAVPWEFLYDPEDRFFLGSYIRTPIVRTPDASQAIGRLPGQKPLRVLALLASPNGHPKLNIEKEWSLLQQAVAGKQDEILIERVQPPTFDALREQLRRATPGYQVLHFTGHGAFDRTVSDGVLVMEDEQGNPDNISASSLARMLRNVESLELAVLNSCEGAAPDTGDLWVGAAQALLLQGVSAAIAMQYEISDPAAIAFSREFYRGLADGNPIETALADARTALPQERFGVEWATPALYLRSLPAAGLKATRWILAIFGITTAVLGLVIVFGLPLVADRFTTNAPFYPVLVLLALSAGFYAIGLLRTMWYSSRQGRSRWTERIGAALVGLAAGTIGFFAMPPLWRQIDLGVRTADCTEAIIANRTIHADAHGQRYTIPLDSNGNALALRLRRTAWRDSLMVEKMAGYKQTGVQLARGVARDTAWIVPLQSAVGIAVVPHDPNLNEQLAAAVGAPMGTYSLASHPDLDIDAFGCRWFKPEQVAHFSVTLIDPRGIATPSRLYYDQTIKGVSYDANVDGVEDAKYSFERDALLKNGSIAPGSTMTIRLHGFLQGSNQAFEGHTIVKVVP